MAKFDLGVWVSRPFPRTWTHVIKGTFADPQSATQGATDLFCYDQNAGIGAFFATVRNGRLDDGTLVQDGPQQVGPNHSFTRRWTHVVTGRFPDLFNPFPVRLYFYDAVTGGEEYYATDGHGQLKLLHSTSATVSHWTKILTGRFGQSPGFLLYDAAQGTGHFFGVDQLGHMTPLRAYSGWRRSWHTIVVGNFSDSPYDDLLFYDKSAGVGEFYRLDANAGMTQFSVHNNWRPSWQHIVPGQFLQNAAFDGLLFYEEGTGFTECYSTDGHGSISRIDINPGDQWRLPWTTILAGEFTPNIGLIGTSRLCSYDATDGTIRYFYLEPATIATVLDLNGGWTAGSQRRAIISAAFTGLTVDMSAYHRPAAHGTILDASTISVTFPDDATYTGRLQPPNIIRWSNNSVWTKG